MPSRGRVWRRGLPQLSPCPAGRNGFQGPSSLGDTSALLCHKGTGVSPPVFSQAAWKEPAKSKFLCQKGSSLI